MKASKVSALRSKRGLHRVSGAEPQVVGLTPQTTNERRANTMKTYLLRAPKTVESQTEGTLTTDGHEWTRILYPNGAQRTARPTLIPR
jgi:hypothetical protein